MTPSLPLCQMETEHRQTKAHLDMIERQIRARAKRITITAKAKARQHRRSRARWTRSDETIFRACVEQLSFERSGEIDALSRKLSRQERAVLVVRAKTTSGASAAKAEA